ncbi:MAG: hypothetical protein IMF06_15555 [Proteobacteria bacterium]|nr:hypothetical protein [Pseudomonadota bacterium]
MKQSLLSLVSIAFILQSLTLGAVNKYAVDGPFLWTAQAPIDEAFESVTSGNNIQDASVDWQKELPEGFQAKRNSSYPWGTTTYGEEELWVGTIAQGWCVWPVQNLNFPMYLNTYQSEFTGCSAQSVLSSPSDIYVFNFEKGTRELIHEKTLTSGGEEYTQATQPHDEMSALSIMGLRAAGNYGDLIFFAGHHLHSGNEGWLRIFVFNAKTRSFLGFRELRGDTTRRFATITDENGNEGFYTILGAETGMTQNGEGPTVMLRWVGTEEEPFKGGNYLQTGNGKGAGWDVVSAPELDGNFGMIGDFKQFSHVDGSERLIMSSASHPHLYDSDTGKRDPSKHESVMLLSEPIPIGGWTRDRPMKFEIIFGMDRYDPDVKGRWGAKWGTTNFHNGYIYFGTYHQGTSAGYSHFKEADPDLFDQLTDSDEGLRDYMANQWRASSVFRMKIEDVEAIAQGKKNPELLYGYDNFRVANNSGTWETVRNKLGVDPLFGEAGMGHPGNIYSWTSLSKNGQLFWGFFDAFSGAHDLLFKADASRLLLLPGYYIPVPYWEYFRDTSEARVLYDWAKSEMQAKGMAADFVPGGDLVVFEGDGPARVLTSKGFGNSCANGVRNVEVLNDRIFFATSTWCNLSDRAGLEFYEYKRELDKKKPVDLPDLE